MAHPLPTLQPGRILLVKPSSLGDIVDALPVAAGLRQRYPQAHIAWLAKPIYAPLVSLCPDVDEVIPLCPGLRGLLRAAWLIRQGKFDLAVDLQGLFRSGWVAFAGAVPARLGLSSARECASIWYTHTVPVPTMEMHAVERYWLTARALGCGNRIPRVNLSIPEDDRREILRHLKGGGREKRRLVVFLPAARWPSKCWPAERFAVVADQLARETDTLTVLAGSPADRPVARLILQRTNAPVLDLTGRTTLPQLAALLAEAEVVVSVDTGPMHLAAALGRPIVAIFGPTNPLRTGPYRTPHRVLTAGVNCQPCYRRRCRNPVCLEAVSPERVACAVLEMLNTRGQDTEDGGEE